MAYHHYVEQGKFPREIHDLDILEYLKINLWKMTDMQAEQQPRQAYIEDFI